MIVVTEQAEEKLSHALQAMKSASGQGRCIYLEAAHAAATELPEIARDHIKDPDTQIFICDEGDAFIVAARIPTKEFEALCSGLHVSPPTGLTLLDVRADWFALSSRAERLLETKRAQARAAKENEMALRKKTERQRILDLPLNESLVNSIPRRRAERERKSILLVEDDPFTKTLITASLGVGPSVTPAASGEDAIRAYVSAAPDIVFLDIGLPDISGHDVLAKLLKADPAAFVVMLSGGGSRDNIVQAITAGAKGFIAKPFTKEKLMQYIEKATS